MHVFVSYKHEDGDFAENVMSRLEQQGFQTWADDKIGAGVEWRNAIDLAIKNSFALVVIMTPEAKASEYVTYEWAFAWGIGIRVIPVMLKKTELHPRLEALQYLDFTNRNVRPWERLFEEIQAASHAPLAHTIRIPLNAPPFVRQAVIALDSASVDERRSAIATLTQAWKATDACGVLIEALKHPIPDVRFMAAQALGEIKDPSAVPALIEALGDSDRQVRHMVAQALGEIKDPSAVPALIEALDDSDKDVRCMAAQALGEIKDPSAAPALIEALDDSDKDVRLRAAQALGEIKDPSAVPALIEALDAYDEDARCMAAQALGEIKDPSAAPALIKALHYYSDFNDAVPDAAAQALGRLKGSSVVSALIEALGDSGKDVRLRAAQALGEIKDPSAISALTKALHDSDVNVRRTAGHAIRNIKDRA